MITALGIETSCDETAASIVELQDNKLSVLSNVISSHIDLFKLYGGVVPELASREHLLRLPAVIDEALNKSQKTFSDIDLIGVTVGPGLKGCLLIGKDYAQGLSLSTGLPLAGVHHIEGHILSAFIEHTIPFPFLSLVVSGGHTEIVLVKDIAEYELIAKTKDDAAGEAFDKSGTLLGLSYPAGAALSKLAEAHTCIYPLPIGLKQEINFSFSGLKTAVKLLVESKKDSKDDEKPNIAASVEEAIVSALHLKLKQAIALTSCTRVSFCGGVSVNRKLREVFSNDKSFDSYFVSPEFCTDNAAMIAVTALLRKQKGCVDSNVQILARTPVTERNFAIV